MRTLVALLAALLVAASAAASPGGHEPQQAQENGHDDGAHGHGDDAVTSPEMYHNETWNHTFTEPGTFEYHCHPHPWMQASIMVLEANGTAMNHTITIIEPDDFEDWSFDPVELTIRAGDTVTWVNAGQQMHLLAETTEEHADHIAAAGSTVEPLESEHDHGHDHGDESRSNLTPVLWIVGAIGIGLVIAQSARKGRQ